MKLILIRNFIRFRFPGLALMLMFAGSNGVAAETLTLQKAEQVALQNEPGILGLNAKTQSMMEKSIAAGELMDPKLQIGVLNLPTDTFDFDQEAMTQLKVSYIQQFPSGDSLEIKRDKAVSQSRQFQHQIEERKRQLLAQVRLSYLETLYWEQARDTVTQNRQLVGQLSDFVQSQFSVGRTNQFEFITVQQSLSKLDDRLTQIEQNISGERYKLLEWIGDKFSQQPLSTGIPILEQDLWENLNLESINQSIAKHPRIQEFNNQIDVNRKDLELIRESEKPGWALNVSYAYRDDEQDGTDRADFFSAMVTMDLPLFTENRQQKQHQAQQYEIKSSKLQRDALLRKLRSDALRLKTNLELLEQRDALYRETLVPQAEQRSQAALQTYQSGNGSFADVMQAYMEALNIELEQKRIQIDSLKSRARLLYFVQASSDAEQQL
jgi:outer membrane protein TolC